MKNNFSDWLLNDGEARLNGKSLQLDVRLPWYRSLPLSVVEIESLSVNGQQITPEAVQIEINGKCHPANLLEDLNNEWWFVLDFAVLHLDVPDVDPVASYKIELTLNLYPPYIPGLKWVTKAIKNLAPQKI